MPAETEAMTIAVAGVEAGPTADRRAAAIGSGNPSRPHQTVARHHTLRRDAGYRHSPHQANAVIDRVLDHQVVQLRAAQTQAMALREAGFHTMFVVREPDALEGMTACRRDIDPERAGGGEPIGHDAFSAGFVDRWYRTIGERDVKAATAGGDGSGKPSRAASDHKEIGAAR
jgi:hypothetical protein